MDTVDLVVYGSLMANSVVQKMGVIVLGEQIGQLHDLEIGFLKISTENRLYRFATPIEVSGSTAWVKIYTISREALAALDEREGVPTDYERKTIPVTTCEGKGITAEIYVANPNKIATGGYIFPAYFNHVLDGANGRHNGLSLPESAIRHVEKFRWMVKDPKDLDAELYRQLL